MRANTDDIEAVIIEGNQHVIVQRVGVSLDQPRSGDAERLPAHVAQQTLSALNVYLDDRRTILLKQRVNLCRMKQCVRHDRDAIISANLNKITQIHIDCNHGIRAMLEPMINRGDVAAIVSHAKVTSTKIQNGDTRAINVAPMIGRRFAGDGVF